MVLGDPYERVVQLQRGFDSQVENCYPKGVVSDIIISVDTGLSVTTSHRKL